MRRPSVLTDQNRGTRIEVVMHFPTQLWILLLIPVISLQAFPSGSPTPTETTPELIPCKEDWFLFGDNCYKVGGGNIGLTWEQASIYCSQEEGNLVTIKSKELQDFLVNFLLLNVKTDVWIGGRMSDFQFRWTDQSAIAYSNFVGEIVWDKRSGYNCAEMQFFSKHGIGIWNLNKCDTKQPYICESNRRVKSTNLDPRFCSNEKGGGWKYSNSCYHIITEKKTWEEAEKHCQTFRGHLVTILDETTKQFLDYILPDFDYFWIGIKTRRTVPQKWSSGWRAMADFSITEQYKPILDNICFLTGSSGDVIHDFCDGLFPYICETSTEKPPIEDDWDCPGLSGGWKNANGELCYLFQPHKKLNWFEANYECMRKGGALISIHSKEKAAFLYSVTRKLDINTKMFIGLHRNLSDKKIFEWIDGNQMSYQRWSAGEPNNIREECAELFTSNMRWNDRTCNEQLEFICSAKKVPPKVIFPEMKECAISVPSVTENVEHDTCNCTCSRNDDTMVEGTIKSEKESITDEKYSTQAQNRENLEIVTSTSRENLQDIFIESSVITPEAIKKENLYAALLEKEDWPIQDSSELVNALADPIKLRKASEERALTMRHKTQEHELIMKLIKEEHELRMSVLNQQLKVLKQISEKIEQNPKSIHLVV